jgi:predicted porin
MQAKKLILIGASLGFASVGVQAQSTDQLQQALAQAQAAAAQAQAAANQAQAALEQALAAAYEARKSSVSAATSSAEKSGGGGLTVGSSGTSLTLYGLIDVTISNADHKDAKNNSLTGFQTPWFSGSRWGVTGNHDLASNGLKAIFRLESEFVPATGDMDTEGYLFNRDAWAGLQSEDLGKLSFGRQNALGRDFSAIYGDPYGAAKASLEEGGYTNTNNFKQLVYYGGSANGTRINNGVVWKKALSNGLVAGAAYSFGTAAGVNNATTTGSSAANPVEGTTVSAALGYNAGDLNVAGFVTQAKVDGLTDIAYSIGGNYTMGSLRMNAGYFRYTAEQGTLGNRTDDAYTLSVKYAPAGSMDYELGYQNMKANNAANNGTGGTVKNAFASIAGLTAVTSGNRNTLYGSMFYHFDKTTEVYVAADFLNMDVGYGNVNGSATQTEVAVGMRTRF